MANAYRNINEQLGSFYETLKEDVEKEELKQQIAELSAQLEQKSSAFIEVNDQMAMLEKSYELAAKYMNGGRHQTVRVENADIVNAEVINELKIK